MRFYIVRHGIALDLGEQGIRSDWDRPLSVVGQRKTRLAAEGLRRLGHAPNVVASSPLVRAEQTATIFRDVLQVKSPVMTVDFMAPGGSPTEALRWLADFTVRSVMVVGHMPDVAWLTNACLPEAERRPLTFKKAAVAIIDFPEKIALGQGALTAFFAPAELRAHADAE